MPIVKKTNQAEIEIWRKEKFAGCIQTNLSISGVDEDFDGSAMYADFNYPGSGNLPHLFYLRIEKIDRSLECYRYVVCDVVIVTFIDI